VPVIAYNIPHRTGRGLGADALLELAATDNVAGVKQAVGGIDADSLRVLAEAGKGFAVLGGDDAFLFPLTLMGAAGAIAASAHLCTRRFVEMIGHGLRGDVRAGRAHAEALLPLVQALFAEPSPAVIKALLHRRGRIASPALRMPLAEAGVGAVQRRAGARRRGGVSRHSRRTTSVRAIRSCRVCRWRENSMARPPNPSVTMVSR
jgi:4-hydroxy-tetrahydrodipicolinate synthase